MKSSTRQQLCNVALNGSGQLFFMLSYAAIVTGTVWLAGVGAIALTMAVFLGLVWCFERDPVTGKPRPIYHRGQSYLFMAGPFLVTPMFMLAAEAWHQHGPRVETVTWLIVGLVVAVVFGIVFRGVDNARYIDHGAKAMLDSPSKAWIDYWQMPGLVGLVVVAVAPTWWMSGPEKWWTIGLVVCCVLLGAVDATRDLIPEDQHVRWDRAACKPAS